MYPSAIVVHCLSLLVCMPTSQPNHSRTKKAQKATRCVPTHNQKDKQKGGRKKEEGRERERERRKDKQKEGRKKAERERERNLKKKKI